MYIGKREKCNLQNRRLLSPNAAEKQQNMDYISNAASIGFYPVPELYQRTERIAGISAAVAIFLFDLVTIVTNRLKALLYTASSGTERVATPVLFCLKMFIIWNHFRIVNKGEIRHRKTAQKRSPFIHIGCN